MPDDPTLARQGQEIPAATRRADQAWRAARLRELPPLATLPAAPGVDIEEVTLAGVWLGERLWCLGWSARARVAGRAAYMRAVGRSPEEDPWTVAESVARLLLRGWRAYGEA